MAKRTNDGDIAEIPCKLQMIKFADENVDRKREIFYDICADTEFCLSDNRSIKICKAILCYVADSNVLIQMMFGPLKDDVTILLDIDSLTFRLFLDCLLDLEPCTFDIAFTVFPVAWKYQVDKCIKKCIDALKHSVISLRTSEILNMAMFFSCTELAKNTIQCIFKYYGSYKFLENKGLFFALEPESVYKILKYVSGIDSYLINILLEWGENYMKSCGDKYQSITDLFVKSRISEYIDIRCFDSASSLFEFSFTDLGKELFTKESFTSLDDIVFLRSKWKIMKRGDSHTEEIKVNLLEDSKNCSYIYGIKTNPIVFYDLHLYKKVQNDLVSVDLTLSGVKNPLILRTGLKCLSYNDCDRSCYYHPSRKCMFSCRQDSSLNLNYFSVKIKYTFPFDCRILLTNYSQEIELNDPSKLFFTRNIPFQQLH